MIHFALLTLFAGSGVHADEVLLGNQQLDTLGGVALSPCRRFSFGHSAVVGLIVAGIGLVVIAVLILVVRFWFEADDDTSRAGDPLP